MTDLIINSSNNEMKTKEENNINKEEKIKYQNDGINNNSEENLNEINIYDPNSLISLSVNKSIKLPFSKTDKIILEYNQIKTNFNKIISIFNNIKSSPHKNKDKYIKKLSEYNMTLLNYFGELSTLLNKLLDNPKIYTNKNLLNSLEIIPKQRIIFTQNNQIFENPENILSKYEKQYNKIKERLTKIKSDNFLNDLQTNISKINNEIIKYEKENIELKKEQILYENSFKNIINGKTPQTVENNIQKKLDICKRIENVYIKTSKKIDKNNKEITNNSKKINLLSQKCQNLKKMAKDIYSIEQFEPVELIKKKSEEKKEKLERKIREYEINIHSLKSGLNKLKIKYEQNKSQIESLEKETNNLIDKYKKKENQLQIVTNKIKEFKNINGINKENNLQIKNRKNNGNKINNNLKTESEESYKRDKLIEENKNIINKRNDKTLASGGPSLISLTKEKSNFGDFNDIQLITPIENREENDKKENDKDKEKRNNYENKINQDININIIGSNNKNKDSNLLNKKQEKKEKDILIKKNNTLSKEMILKGLDSQEKNNPMIYSSRNIPNKESKGKIDRRNLLKLNFSFVSPSKDNRLNRSLNTLPNERNMLNYEIAEDIILDSNSANNINKNSKERRFNTNIEDVQISQDKIENTNINNNSVEIDRNLINNEFVSNEKESIEKNDENEDKNKDKRENALNTILYNEVDNKTRNEKFLESNNNNDNNNKEEDQANKSFEEEHVFDIMKKEIEENKENENKDEEKENKDEEKENKDEKKENKEEEEEKENKDEEKENENPKESENYDFDYGDDIIEVDYDKI